MSAVVREWDRFDPQDLRDPYRIKAVAPKQGSFPHAS